MSLRIIHIEDNKDWQTIVSDAIRINMPKTSVKTVDNIDAALHEVRKSEKPALLILDLHLGESDDAYSGLEWLMNESDVELQGNREMLILSGHLFPPVKYLLIQKGINQDHIFGKGIDWDQSKFVSHIKQIKEKLEGQQNEIEKLKSVLSEDIREMYLGHHAFISYSHKDQEYSNQLADAMQAQGFAVWIDKRIEYVTKWPNVIREHLDSCGAFVVIMTRFSYRSVWVQNELDRAVRMKKPIFPLVLDGNKQWLSIETIPHLDVRGSLLPNQSFYIQLAHTIPKSDVGQPILPEPFSVNELRLIRCLCDGMTNSTISQSLNIHVNQLRKDLKRIYAKFNVTNRIQAAKTAQKLGIN